MDKMDSRALSEFFNMLLEAERAGVKVLGELVRQVEAQQLKTLLNKFLRDEGVNCRILVSFINDLGEAPSDKTGAFAEKVFALDTLHEKMNLLIRGQEWVARKIREFRNRLPAGSTHLFLEAIKIQHEENVDSLKKYLAE